MDKDHDSTLTSAENTYCLLSVKLLRAHTRFVPSQQLHCKCRKQKVHIVQGSKVNLLNGQYFLTDLNQENEFMLQKWFALHVQSASIPAALFKLENKAINDFGSG